MQAGAQYVGRFAPSPTGSLHLGSLVAALASFLDARHHGGRWLVRIEDLDTPRVIPGCADQMLRTLEQFGLWWDGEVEYQSRHPDRYEAALKALHSKDLTYQCICSRRELAAHEESGYPGTCRERNIARTQGATRFRVDDARVIEVEDRFQGTCRFELARLGDFIVRRRDGVIAYQLAVVVDDACQGITHVVRGADLLESTGWQMALQDALGLPRPAYGHVPVVVEPDGSKLAKSRRAVPLDPGLAAPALHDALTLLAQAPPPALRAEPPASIVAWATRNWHPEAFRGRRQVSAP